MNAFRHRLSLAVALFVAATGAIAGDLSPQVVAVRDRWAEVNYNTPKKQREAAFEALAKQAAAARTAQPKDAGALIWEGIVLSSFAGERGGLGAMSLAKQAKADFEQAIKLEPTALDGSAYNSLGVLYYKVPGWPVGFGDKKRAKELLEQALALNPRGIDPNFFYGEYLLETGHAAEAVTYLERALQAPARPGRQVADTGRREEARALLEKARSAR